LSGNYVTPLNLDGSDSDSDEEGDLYDLSPDEDELLEDDSEADELDDLDDRITEIV
jgi:hypothetical protein